MNTEGNRHVWKQHLEQLAAKTGTSITWMPATTYHVMGFASTYWEQNRVVIPEPVDQLYYYTGLHELGHINTLDERSHFKTPDEVMQAHGGGGVPERWKRLELAAWTWALENALEPPGLETSMYVRDSLRSYQVRDADIREIATAVRHTQDTVRVPA